jgi:mannose-6-phosphate isomerase-like protein (cupin superfamily)
MTTVVRADEAERLALPDGSALLLLADPAVTGCDLSVHHTVLRDGVDGAGPHHHETSAEVFYVIAGHVELLVDDDVVVAGEGDLVAVSPGTVHAFRAVAGHDAELLVLTPTVERFDLFRQALGHADPDGDPDRFDTHPDHSPTWLRARTRTAP